MTNEKKRSRHKNRINIHVSTCQVYKESVVKREISIHTRNKFAQGAQTDVPAGGAEPPRGRSPGSNFNIVRREEVCPLLIYLYALRCVVTGKCFAPTKRVKRGKVQRGFPRFFRDEGIFFCTFGVFSFIFTFDSRPLLFKNIFGQMERCIKYSCAGALRSFGILNHFRCDFVLLLNLLLCLF